MPPVRLALGILRLADISMAATVRRQTLERGRDPRDFLLVASGGAGPMHACAVAAEVGIRDVLVPIHPGHFSAFGMLQADLRFERTRRILQPLATLDRAAFDAAVDELSQSVGELLTASGALDDVVFSHRVTLRYEGQFHSLDIALPPGPDGHGDVAAAQALFEKEYARRYGDYDRRTDIELVDLQVQGARRLSRPHLEPERGSAERTDAVVPAWFGLDEAPVDTTVVQRAALRTGDELVGPSVVCESGSTTVVPPGWRARLDEHGNIRIRQEEGEHDG